MSSGQQYCLRWNNHSSNFITVFEQLLRTEAFTDVTVSVPRDGTQIKCHKMVLAACSSYFRDLLIENPCKHPIIVLTEVKYSEIKAILDYMYRGEVNVAQDELAGLLRAAAFFKVKGLVEEPSRDRQREDGGVADSEMSPPPGPNHSMTNNPGLSNGYVSPSHGHSYIPSNLIPYGKSPIERHHTRLWTAFSAALPLSQHPISGQPPRSQHSILGTSYDSTSETSPLSRKKLSALMACRDTPILRNVLGQGHMDSTAADRQDASCSNSNASLNDSDRRNSAELSESMMEDYDSGYSPPNGIGSCSGAAAAAAATAAAAAAAAAATATATATTAATGTGTVAVPDTGTSSCSAKTGKSGTKPEWKRYKQYTRENIQEAMDAVREKRMSALQAARRYGVPSRTLYDKLKKAGILPSRGLGISRQRESNNVVVDNGSARFPYSSSVNGSVYGSSPLSESESDTSGLQNGSLVMDMSTRSPSPAQAAQPAQPAQSAQQFAAPVATNEDPVEDHVEDLSVARTSTSSSNSNSNATPVIVPPSATITATIKQEPVDTSQP